VILAVAGVAAAGRSVRVVQQFEQGRLRTAGPGAGESASSGSPVPTIGTALRLSGRYRLVVRWVTGRARCGRVTGSSGRVVVYGGEARELDA